MTADSDNAPLHVSTPLERMQEEHAQLNERLSKLRKFLDSPVIQNFPPEEQELLAEQALVMSAYSAILEKRIAIWRY